MLVASAAPDHSAFDAQRADHRLVTWVDLRQDGPAAVNGKIAQTARLTVARTSLDRRALARQMATSMVVT